MNYFSTDIQDLFLFVPQLRGGKVTLDPYPALSLRKERFRLPSRGILIIQRFLSLFSSSSFLLFSTRLRWKASSKMGSRMSNIFHAWKKRWKSLREASQLHFEKLPDHWTIVEFNYQTTVEEWEIDFSPRGETTFPSVQRFVVEPRLELVRIVEYVNRHGRGEEPAIKSRGKMGGKWNNDEISQPRGFKRRESLSGEEGRKLPFHCGQTFQQSLPQICVLFIYLFIYSLFSTRSFRHVWNEEQSV